MQKEPHYIIGDVHGEYEILLALIRKLPQNARLIFVGDLVNRGQHSQEVVEYVRQHAYAVLKGNHEGYFLEHGKNIIKQIEENPKLKLKNLWNYLGGVQMMWSYKVLKRSKENSCEILRNPEGLANLKSDIAWVEKLPLYLELGEVANYDKPVVISHASIGDYWDLRDTSPDNFEVYSLSNRKPPSQQSPIFNIYGHEVVEEVTQGESFVALDTGCGKVHGASLSAYCLETKEVIQASLKDLD